MRLPPSIRRSPPAAHDGHADDHGNGAARELPRRGGVDHARNGFDPHEILRDFDWGTTRRLPSGRVLREWELVARDQEIEVAPGVAFAAWTYNGRIPGPTLRAARASGCGSRFVNGSAHPHTIHFHGIHPADMDGVPGPRRRADRARRRDGLRVRRAPSGLHLYHCHVRAARRAHRQGPLRRVHHRPQGRAASEADELVMVMNGFDTNFDRANEVYAANTIGFAYMDRADRGRSATSSCASTWSTCSSTTSINSFHLHGNLFDYFPTGTSLDAVASSPTR